MQDSSAFQYLAIDQIHESITNPRQTFEQNKLEELAESIRQHGLIQPITVRPNATGFEIVAGARRFRAAQLAELFSLPARIVELDAAAAMEWQLVENSQRVDVHPYEEAQGFQRLLDLPGYDVAALVSKSGKSAAHVYARLPKRELLLIQPRGTKKLVLEVDALTYWVATNNARDNIRRQDYFDRFGPEHGLIRLAQDFPNPLS